jgi:hypothetical protein
MPSTSVIATFTFSAVDARTLSSALFSRDLALAMTHPSILLATVALATQVSSPDWWFEGTHVRVGVLESSRVVVLERTSVPAGELDPAEMFAPVDKALATLDRGRYGILIDVRTTPGRNDAEFEQRFAPVRQRLQRGFLRVAIVVKSTSGKLQSQRYARVDNIASNAFDDYAAAVKWLEEVTLRP